MQKAVVINGLVKFFKKVKVLHGIDLEVDKGTMLALLGPNGAGKTTSIRILSTLLKQDGGTAVVNGYDTKKDPDKVRESIGLTGQFAAVDEYLTGQENLEMMESIMYTSKFVDGKRLSQVLRNTLVPKILIRTISARYRKNWEKHNFNKTPSVKLLEVAVKRKLKL